MKKFLRTPITGIVVAGAAAVLPTLIIAKFSVQSPGTSESSSMHFHNVQADVSTPATRPFRQDRFGGGGSGSFGGGEGRPRLGLMNRRPDMSEEEKQAAIEFFTENSPKRMAYFSQMPEGAHRMATIKLVQAYRPILNFKDTNSDLYNLLVQQVKLRDEAFVLARDGKDADLRAKAAEIVPLALKAREIRLAALQKELTDQETKLNQDKANPDATAEHEVSLIKDDEEWWTRDRPKPQSRQSKNYDFDVAADPLAAAAPISSGSIN